MGRHKQFTARKSPQYTVITVCSPELIDGVTLKIRDLHVLHSVMADYTFRYVEKIEAEHRRCGTALDLTAPISAATRDLEQLIRIMFSAALSAYESVVYYAREAADDAGRKWIDARMRSNDELNAFERLRNRDIHHEPLHTLIGMRYRVVGSASVSVPADASGMHIHAHLSHEGPGIYPYVLAQTPQFAPHPGLVDTLTFESILQLVHRCIHAVVQLINNGISARHLPKSIRKQGCTICVSDTMTS